MHKKTRGLIEIHIAVLLAGLVGLFGKLLTLSPVVIVYGRVFFASIALGLLIAVTKRTLCLPTAKAVLPFIGLGIILAVHWVTFFHSVQVSTVAIGLITFSTFPIFVAFMEPFMFKERLRMQDAFLAIIALAGIVILVPSLEIGNSITQGVLWGVASGFTYALLSLLNRKYVQKYPSVTIAFYQDVFAALVLLPFVLIEKPIVTINDMGWLLLLGVVFTALAHSLFIGGMLHIKTRTASMIACLEPLYGVIVAALLIHEIPSARTMIGGLIIVFAAFYATLHESKQIIS